MSDNEIEIQTAAYQLQVKKRSDNLINYFLACYFLAGLVFACFYETWVIAIGSGGLCLIAYYSAKKILPDSDLYQYVLSVVLGIFMAQFIYQMHGLFEMHFFAFIGSAILIIYQNWKLQVPMLLVVVIHHIAFGYLQNSGLGNVFFMSLNKTGMGVFIIHFFLAAVIFFICGLWGYQLKKSSKVQIMQSIAMNKLEKDALMAQEMAVMESERHAAELDKAVAQGKFEIASDVMHDIGNAVVGFGSYLTRIRRVQEQDRMDSMMSLTRFFEENKPAIGTAIGEAKAAAVIKMLAGIALTQRCNQEEVAKSITEQLNIITHIQEILNIQRQYITGKGTKERQPVNLKHVINDSLSMVFASIDKMAIGVSLEMPQELPIIKGDRTKLMQALLNILKNSIEAIDKNAEEKIITLNAFTKPGQLVIQIKDSGAGFDKSTGSQMFNRGFSTKFSGSGFGLYNCRSIIESHDGTIDISSEGPGKGSVTTIGFKLSA